MSINIAAKALHVSPMGGALLQIVATSPADQYLTGDPNITFWRNNIKRHTNFAIETSSRNLTSPQFGGYTQITLDRTGDLVHKAYLVVTLPGLKTTTAGGSNQFVLSNNTGTAKEGTHIANVDGLRSSTDFPAGDAPYLATRPGQGYVQPLPLSAADLKDDASMGGTSKTEDYLKGITGTGDASYAYWVDEIGHALLESVDLNIGGQNIDTIYGRYLHMWEELSGKPGKRLGEMVGKRYQVRDLVVDSSKDRVLYIPLMFSCWSYAGNALPLVALQFHSVTLNFKFAPLNKLIVVNASDTSVAAASGGALTNNSLRCQVDFEYVYLDIMERDLFAGSSNNGSGGFHQLITQVQEANHPFSTQSSSYRLDFNHGVIELLWQVQRQLDQNANHTFRASGKYGEEPLQKVGLKLSGRSRFDKEAQFFRLVQPHIHHTNIPDTYVYCYSFSLHPEHHQPSGTCNFSRIDNITIDVTCQQDIASESKTLFVYARCWNVLKFKNGLAGVLYAN